MRLRDSTEPRAIVRFPSFIYADSADRAKRIAERVMVWMKNAPFTKAQKVDRMRKHHFDFYADTLWGEPESYDLMLSSSEYGIDGAASVIASARFIWSTGERPLGKGVLRHVPGVLLAWRLGKRSTPAHFR
ncbi:MAG: cytidylate kinase family protein [Oscillospiraceae bacterium]